MSRIERISENLTKVEEKKVKEDDLENMMKSMQQKSSDVIDKVESVKGAVGEMGSMGAKSLMKSWQSMHKAALEYDKALAKVVKAF